MKKYVVIVAGGKGKRMNSEMPKQFLLVNDRPILFHTIDRFLEIKDLRIVLVLPSSDIHYWNQQTSQYKIDLKRITTVNGGKERFDSVYNGFSSINEDEALVAIHDGVRSFVSKDVIEKSFLVAEQKGNAVSSVKLKDSIRFEKSGQNKAVNRSEYKIIQTPQTFKLSILHEAFDVGYKDFFTDDASVVEHAGYKINLIEGNYENIKITTPEDLLFAQAILNRDKK